MASPRRKYRKTAFRKKRSSSTDKPIRLGPEFHSEFHYLKKHIDKFWEFVNETAERLHDLEVHADLMQRLLVTLAMQKMNIPLGELRHIIRAVEREAIAESEVIELEQLFKLPAKKPAAKTSFRDRRKSRKRTKRK